MPCGSNQRLDAIILSWHPPRRIKVRSSVFRRSFKQIFPFSRSRRRRLRLGHRRQTISRLLRLSRSQFHWTRRSRNCRRDGRTGSAAGVRPHQPIHHAIAEQYAEELLAFAGNNFRGGAVYFTSGGSEAIETALKLARQYQVEIGQPRRHQILSRQQSYHGSTLGALSVSGNKRRREIYLPMVREFAHIGIPYCYRCDFDCTDGCRNCGQQYAAELDKPSKMPAAQPPHSSSSQ